MLKKAFLFSILLSVMIVTGSLPAYAVYPVVSDTRTGIDISWPQCGEALPTGMAYAIVGVNGGTAASTNGCLAEQLAWASVNTTGVNPSQPRVQLYVNTANPGEVLEQYQVTSWPTDNIDGRGRSSLENPDPVLQNPYGACVVTPGNYGGYTNDLACSWQYGWNRSVEAVDLRFAPAAEMAGMATAAAAYTWWLDVETMNTWQVAGTSEAYARNTASLEGMAAFYRAEGVEHLGLYSTSYQWGLIVGNTLRFPAGDGHTVGGNLIGIPSWLAGAWDADDAQRRCLMFSGLTGGPVVLNQYIWQDLDHNYSCV